MVHTRHTGDMFYNSSQIYITQKLLQITVLFVRDIESRELILGYMFRISIGDKSYKNLMLKEKKEGKKGEEKRKKSENDSTL